MSVHTSRGIWRRWGGAVAAVGLLAAGLAACGDQGGEVDGIRLVQADKLTVCTHLPYEPFQVRDENGEVVGFDVDLLDLLAEDLGVEQEVVDVGEWEQVTSGAVFKAGRCDIGMGAMTITEQRKRALTISDPYFEATQALLVKKGSGYQSLEDLRGKQVGVQTGTTGQSFAEENKEKYGFTPRNFEDLALQLNAVKAGTVDAGINDNQPLLNFAKENPDTEVVADFKTGEVYGFPAKKNDPNAEKLIDRLNGLLAKAKQDGTYDRIYKKWFGTEPPA